MRIKLLLLLIIGILSFGAAKAQYVTIPDSSFRSFLIGKYPACFNASSQMDTSCSSILNASELIMENLKIEDLNGIQYFKNLVYLSCSHNYILANIPALPPSLDTLDLRTNSLTGLPPIPSSLKYLDVVNNLLDSLPVLPNNLTVLYCGENPLTSLGTLPDSLNMLYCGSCYLTTLPTLPNNLTWLECSDNQIQTFPTLPPSLEKLFCGANKIRQTPVFPVSLRELNIRGNPLNSFSTAQLPNLEYLDCASDSLTSLPILPNTLKYLYCGANYLTSLPSRLPDSLLFLRAENNQITHLTALSAKLQYVSIQGNNIRCLPVLPNTLQSIELDSSEIPCIPNSTSGLNIYDINNPTIPVLNYPLCNAVNNVYGCQSFPLIQGKVFYDLNSNGILDMGEYCKKNYKVGLSNSAFTLTNDSGFYQLSPDTIGNVSLIPTASVLIHAVPAVQTFNFTSYDTLVVQDIALQPLIIKDSVILNITANSRARPGFGLGYQVSVENVGTTNLSSTNIVIHYDPTLITYNVSSNPNVTQSGNTLTLNFSTLPVGSLQTFSLNFTVKTSAPLGTIIIADGLVVSAPAFSSDTSSVIITGSFDPNDKTATAKLTPAQLAADGYVDYVVRFQNTGTDTAIHVVLADTLSSKLKANTLQVIATSHLCKTTVKDKVVTFEMRDIMLPDSNVNEFASHGYVRFKVKPVNSLVVGNTVTNKAAIYFDYNSPVMTNTAVTQIVSQTFPLKLLSFKGNRLSQGNVYLYWQTANEENTKSFDIEQSPNGRIFEKIGEVKAFGNGNHSYTFTTDKAITGNVYFRLKMKDKDGAFTYAPIVLIKAGDVKGSFVLGNNPVNDKLVINAINPSLINTEAALINSVGVVVKRFVLNGASQTVAVGNLPAGAYYLRTLQGSEKVVIVR